MSSQRWQWLRYTLVCLILIFSFSSKAANEIQILEHVDYYHVDAKFPLPHYYDEIPTWLHKQKRINGVKKTGGEFYLITSLMLAGEAKAWTLNLRKPLIEHIDYWLYGSDGSVQHKQSGFYAKPQFSLNYARSVDINPYVEYYIIIKVSSRNFKVSPIVEIQELNQHVIDAHERSLLIQVIIGGLLFLMLYHFSLFVINHDKTYGYYSLYVLFLALGWAFTFHIPSQYWNIYWFEIIPILFLMLPICNVLLYKHFLGLPQIAPKLWCYSKWLLVLSCAAIVCVCIKIEYSSAIVATVLLLWLLLALICGNVCFLNGFMPSRYFLMAFILVFIPLLSILPHNLSILPDIIQYAEIALLVGSAIDALFLALALVDKQNINNNKREQRLQMFAESWQNFRRDPMSRLANKYAFDDYINNHISFTEDSTKLSLILVEIVSHNDLTDNLEHEQQHELVGCFVGQLQQISLPLKSFRLSTWKFAVVLPVDNKREFIAYLKVMKFGIDNADFDDVNLGIGETDSELNTNVYDLLRNAENSLYEYKWLKRHHSLVA